jgi:glycosyltransferase involved in cell wall biosynthesis
MSDVKVQVCILTYKRPVLLASALQSVRHQQFTDQPRPQVTVLVVDNDDEQSGREAFEKVSGEDPAARYVVATPKGIAHARNRALDESTDADFIVFLDDDEWASPFWLQALLHAQRSFDAGVVTGPVIPVFDHAPEWLVRSYKSCQYGCQTYETGTQVKFLGNGNTLVRMSVTRDVRFDRRFDLIGLEDADYFLRLQRRGVRIVFAKEAEVYEPVPEHRATAQWLLQRNRWRTNVYTKICLYHNPGITTTTVRLLKAAAAFTVGVALLPTAVAGKHRAIRALHWIYRAAGTVDALRGKTYLHQS